jgi:hypothetical protein
MLKGTKRPKLLFYSKLRKKGFNGFSSRSKLKKEKEEISEREKKKIMK